MFCYYKALSRPRNQLLFEVHCPCTTLPRLFVTKEYLSHPDTNPLSLKIYVMNGSLNPGIQTLPQPNVKLRFLMGSQICGNVSGGSIKKLRFCVKLLNLADGEITAYKK